MEPAFVEGDSVICYEPLLGRIRALYEAKVTGVVKRRTREPAYRLRFLDWNKIYPERRKKCDEGDEEEKAKLASAIILQYYKDKKIRKLPPGLTAAEDKQQIETSPEENLPLIEVKSEKLDDDKEGEFEVDIELDEELKRILEQDCSEIKNKQKLLVHCGPSVIDIFESFMRHYASCLLFEKQRSVKDHYKPEQRIALTKEVLEGLRCLFDTLLPTNLLYNEELPAHETFQHTGSFPENLQCTPEPIRRQTRSSKTETPLHSEIVSSSQERQRSASDASKARATAHQLMARLEGSRENSIECSASKKQRLAPHLQSNIHNSTSGRSTPTHNLQAELFMKEVNEWKLVSKTALIEMEGKGAPLPSSKYGAIYLLRLFVMLPQVLTKMKLGDEWRSFLLSIFTAVLSYLLEERCQFFDQMRYLPADSASPTQS
ncbi:MSL complex subunit 3-like isoform X2 [Watersipora subatra]|uniref:MSL complex subunit 3-like isoform X2 n=1 Tax=Watersipora subatra TaxID=2589382 RepID=UPI00355B45DA